MKKTILLLLLMFVIVGCDKDEPKENTPEPTTLLNTKWKLVGFFDIEKNELIEIKSDGCEDCYALKFVSDEKAKGRTTTESICIEFSKLGKYAITDILRPPADEIFIRALYDQHTTSYSVTTNALKFINEKNKYYLLYKRQ